jgi:hypothetical protein
VHRAESSFVFSAGTSGLRIALPAEPAHLMSELPIDKAVPEGRYANYFKIGFNAYEFVIDFGQEYPPDAERTYMRVVTSPSMARNLVDTLERSLRDYELKFGPLKDAEEVE